jgi:4'-phosphopantetheinyl transferase
LVAWDYARTGQLLAINTTIGAESKINMTGIEATPLREDEVHVWIASLDCRQSDLSSFQSILAEDEIKRANRFYFQNDRERFIAGRGLLRVILSSYVGLPPGEIIFTYGSHGKPELRAQDGRSAIEFNLAHSAGTAIYALTRDRPVGVDIESFQTEFPVEEVAKNFFSSAELAALQALPNTLRTEVFFKCWTRKEAFIKALGDGLSCPLRDFDVSLAPGEPARLLHVRWGSEEASRWCMQDIDCVAGCAAAIALSGPQCSVYVSPWDINNGTSELTRRIE